MLGSSAIYCVVLKLNKRSKFQTKIHNLTKIAKNRFKHWIDGKTLLLPTRDFTEFLSLGENIISFAYLVS